MNDPEPWFMCIRENLPLGEAQQQCDWLDDFHHCEDCANLWEMDIE